MELEAEYALEEGKYPPSYRGQIRVDGDPLLEFAGFGREDLRLEIFLNALRQEPDRLVIRVEGAAKPLLVLEGRTLQRVLDDTREDAIDIFGLDLEPWYEFTVGAKELGYYLVLKPVRKWFSARRPYGEIGFECPGCGRAATFVDSILMCRCGSQINNAEVIASLGSARVAWVDVLEAFPKADEFYWNRPITGSEESPLRISRERVVRALAEMEEKEGV